MLEKDFFALKYCGKRVLCAQCHSSRVNHSLFKIEHIDLSSVFCVGKVTYVLSNVDKIMYAVFVIHIFYHHPGNANVTNAQLQIKTIWNGSRWQLWQIIQ